MIVNSEEVKNATSFNAKIDGDILVAEAKYAGVKTGLKMNVQPGTDSYLFTKQINRKALVKSNSVSKFGPVTISEAYVGGTQYLLNDNGKLEPAITGAKDFDLRNGNEIKYTGTMQQNGTDEEFTVSIKLNFRKK